MITTQQTNQQLSCDLACLQTILCEGHSHSQFAIRWWQVDKSGTWTRSNPWVLPFEITAQLCHVVEWLYRPAAAQVLSAKLSGTFTTGWIGGSPADIGLSLKAAGPL